VWNQHHGFILDDVSMWTQSGVLPWLTNLFAPFDSIDSGTADTGISSDAGAGVDSSTSGDAGTADGSSTSGDAGTADDSSTSNDAGTADDSSASTDAATSSGTEDAGVSAETGAGEAASGDEGGAGDADASDGGAGDADANDASADAGSSVAAPACNPYACTNSCFFTTKCCTAAGACGCSVFGSCL
jgi:hypothetical protein